MSDKGEGAYRTISEAGSETDLPAHVLRFWESKFSQLRPVKRAGGRRLYRPQDITLILGLKHLLYEEGYTIKGAQKYLKEHGVAGLSELMTGADQASAAASSAEGPQAPLFDQATQSDATRAAPQIAPDQAARLEDLLHRLKEARAVLSAVRGPA